MRMNKQEIEKAISNINYGLHYEDCGNMVMITKFSAHMAISALTQQLNNGWIPVSERLPNQEESIKYRAVFLIQDKYIDLPYMAIWNRIKNIWVDEDGDRINSVIAWQPLPPEYKEVSE